MSGPGQKAKFDGGTPGSYLQTAGNLDAAQNAAILEREQQLQHKVAVFLSLFTAEEFSSQKTRLPEITRHFVLLASALGKPLLNQLWYQPEYLASINVPVSKVQIEGSLQKQVEGLLEALGGHRYSFSQHFHADAAAILEVLETHSVIGGVDLSRSRQSQLQINNSSLQQPTTLWQAVIPEVSQSPEEPNWRSALEYLEKNPETPVFPGVSYQALLDFGFSEFIQKQEKLKIGYQPTLRTLYEYVNHYSTHIYIDSCEINRRGRIPLPLASDYLSLLVVRLSAALQQQNSSATKTSQIGMPSFELRKKHYAQLPKDIFPQVLEPLAVPLLNPAFYNPSKKTKDHEDTEDVQFVDALKLEALSTIPSDSFDNIWIMGQSDSGVNLSPYWHPATIPELKRAITAELDSHPTITVHELIQRLKLPSRDAYALKQMIRESKPIDAEQRMWYYQTLCDENTAKRLLDQLRSHNQLFPVIINHKRGTSVLFGELPSLECTSLYDLFEVIYNHRKLASFSSKVLVIEDFVRRLQLEVGDQEPEAIFGFADEDEVGIALLQQSLQPGDVITYQSKGDLQETFTFNRKNSSEWIFTKQNGEEIKVYQKQLTALLRKSDFEIKRRVGEKVIFVRYELLKTQVRRAMNEKKTPTYFFADLIVLEAAAHEFLEQNEENEANRAVMLLSSGLLQMTTDLEVLVGTDDVLPQLSQKTQERLTQHAVQDAQRYIVELSEKLDRFRTPLIQAAQTEIKKSLALIYWYLGQVKQNKGLEPEWTRDQSKQQVKDLYTQFGTLVAKLCKLRIHFVGRKPV